MCQLIFIKYIENVLRITLDTFKACFKNVSLKIVLEQLTLRITSNLGNELGADHKKRDLEKH